MKPNTLRSSLSIMFADVGTVLYPSFALCILMAVQISSIFLIDNNQQTLANTGAFFIYYYAFCAEIILAGVVCLMAIAKGIAFGRESRHKGDSGVTSGADTSSALADRNGEELVRTVAEEGMNVDLEKGKIKAAYVEGGRFEMGGREMIVWEASEWKPVVSACRGMTSG